MKAIFPYIHVIDTRAFGQEQVIASYLIQGPEKTALFDPGFPSSATTVKEELRKNGIDPSGIDYVFLTHFHLDHSGGTGAILREALGAKVIVHKRAAFYVKNFAKIVGGARMVFRAEVIRQFGEAETVPAERVVSVVDGDVIDLGGNVRIRTIHTPGHCGDQVSYLEEGSRAIITGDVACLQYPHLNYVPIPAGSPPLFDLGEEVSSLNALRSVEVEHILVPHYGKVEGPWKDFLDRNIAAIEDTRQRINSMFRENIEFPQMIELLRQDILRAAGKTEDEVPAFLSGIYLREMLKTGLMGFLAYMLEYAPYPRSFSNELCGIRA